MPVVYPMHEVNSLDFRLFHVCANVHACDHMHQMMKTKYLERKLICQYSPIKFLFITTWPTKQDKTLCRSLTLFLKVSCGLNTHL